MYNSLIILYVVGLAHFVVVAAFNHNIFHAHTSSTSSFRSRRYFATTNAQDSSVLVVDEMPPPLPPLNNYYYLLRHGQSTANVEGIISSARSLSGSTKHGLTLLGIEQARESAASLIDSIAEDIYNDDSTKQVYFYSSPFARAKETAEQCIKGINANEEVAEKVNCLGLEINTDITLDDGLLERYFGRLDGKELPTYAYVWPVDMMMPTHTGKSALYKKTNSCVQYQVSTAWLFY